MYPTNHFRIVFICFHLNESCLFYVWSLYWDGSKAMTAMKLPYDWGDNHPAGSSVRVPSGYRVSAGRSPVVAA